MKEKRYRLYIDESGDHVNRDEKSLQEVGHRYLALVGCFFVESAYVPFHSALETLKQKHFPHNPDEPVILHRSDMIACRGPFWRLREEDCRQAFEADFLGVLRDSCYKVIAIVIDKLVHKQTYQITFHPYHMALDFMLQRYCGFLNHISARGDVMAERRGKAEDDLLKKAYRHIYTCGDMRHGADFNQRALATKDIKLKDKKANVSGLQLADNLAHPVRQEILLDHHMIPDPGEIFGKRISEAIQGKYNRHLYDGRVAGYGKVLFPI